MHKIYYYLKPLLPRSVQILFRRIRAKRIYRNLNGQVLGSGIEDIEPHESRWPNNTRCAVLLTHDVETKKGLENIEVLRDIEREFGVVSTWSFVVDKYGDVSKYIEKLQNEGCECAAHGLYHDGKLFSSMKTYESRMEIIYDWAKEHNINGFRSPSLLRNAEWMQDMQFQWDSSFPAWDPFQPQPGGCNKYLPFMLSEKTMEFPVTLWQDFTVFQEMNQRSIDIWKSQFGDIQSIGGLVNVITHPDYSKGMIHFYDTLLSHITRSTDCWVATPAEYLSWIEL